jgi:hypothetical protein
MKKILLVSSSSGGHIYPSVALRNKLKELNYYVTSLGIKNQMEERHKTGQGLYIPGGDSKSNEVIKNRPLLPNEVVIDVNGKNKQQVLEEAINLIDNTKTLLDYDYKMPERKSFRSWIQSYNLNK